MIETMENIDDRPKSGLLHRAIAMGDKMRVEQLLNDGVNANTVFHVDGNMLETAQRKSLHSLRQLRFENEKPFLEEVQDEKNDISDLTERDQIQNNRKSLAKCIDERLNDGNEILIERSESIAPNEQLNEENLTNDEKPLKLIPRLKKKISLKKNRKITRKDIIIEEDDDIEIFRTRNVDDEQLSENYEGVAFFEAVRDGLEMIVQVMLETSNNHQLNLPDENGFTPVMQAAWHNQNDCLHILLQHGANIDLRNITGCNATHFAAGQGNFSCLETLIDYDPDCVNTRTKYGASPLILASKDGHTEVVELLLKNGADPNIKYRGNQNALLFAAGNGHYGCIQHLLNYNINTDQANSQNVTPLMRAVQQGHNECVTLLISHKVNLNLQDAIGRTALHFAVENNNLKALKLLLNAGAKHDFKTKGGSTPLAYAERFSSKTCEDVLVNQINILKEKAATEREIELSIKKEEQTVKCMKLSRLFKIKNRDVK